MSEITLFPGVSEPVEPPPVEVPGPTTYDASSSVGEVAFALLRVQLQKFFSLEAAVRSGEDPEAVHDMRVASRRLRAGMATFRDALPARALRLRDHFRWASAVLGAVRDLDVQRAQIEEWISQSPVEERAGLESLSEILDEQRAVEHRRAVKALDARRYQQLRSSALDVARRVPSRREAAPNLPVVVVAPELVARRHRRLRKSGDALTRSSDAPELHRVRIHAKRLRYALEFLEPVYGEPVGPYVRRLVRLQEVLGDIQDAQVASKRFSEIGSFGRRRLPAETLFAMGRVAERYEHHAAELRRRIDGAYGGVRGKRWKELKRAMERGRAAGKVRTTPARTARAEGSEPAAPRSASRPEASKQRTTKPLPARPRRTGRPRRTAPPAQRPGAEAPAPVASPPPGHEAG